MGTKRTEPYLATYLHAKGGRLGLPIAGNFELTARCNFHCPMCYVHMTEEQVRQRGTELTAEQWISVAEQAKKMGMVFALLTGGEPLVRKDFFEIYKAMKDMGLLISINSNASMIQGEILERFLQDPPYRFNLSLYGASNETYRQMCGQPCFDRVFENMRTMKEKGLDLRINFSITPYNRQDMAQIYQKAAEIGVHIKAASYMYPPIRVEGVPGKNDRMTPEEAARASVDCDLIRFQKDEFCQRAEAMDAGVRLPEECSVDVEEGVSCRAGSSSFWVAWDGTMMPCGMMTRPVAYPLETGFQKAWETILEETRQIRLPLACNNCTKRQICSVCAANCLTETGSYDKVPEYICRMTEETYRLTQEKAAALKRGGSL